jgi:hypothetical protein
LILSLFARHQPRIGWAVLSERSWVKKGSIADGCATQIPLLMAYFLTFLIAPLLDLMSQRPLICMGRVFCKIKKLPREVRAREACRKYFSMVAAHFSPWPSRLYRNPVSQSAQFT